MFNLTSLLARIWGYPGPAGDHEAVDLSTQDRDYSGGLCPRSLYVGTGGTVTVTSLKGTTVSYLNVPSGAVLPVGVKVVVRSSTTAANLVALF